MIRQRQQGFNSGAMLVLLLFLLALAVSTWVSLGITARERWPIRWLELQGSFDRVSAEQLRATLLPLTHSNFFTLDLDALRAAAARIPWASIVKVQKVWPDTVRVYVEEFTPVAHWNRDRLVSSHGEIFQVPEAPGLQGLPWLGGQDHAFDLVLDHWTRFNQALAVHGLEISELNRDERGSWEMKLTSGTEIRLGRDRTEERLERLLASWPALLEVKALIPRSVDLRYTNGFAVTWPQPQQPGEGAGN